MCKQPVAVIFDLDDTLYLERDYVRSGFERVGDWCLGTLGLAGFEKTALRLFEAGVRGRIFDETLREIGFRDDSGAVQRMVQIYREHMPRITLLPDAVECLTALRDRVYLGLITDGVPSSQWQKIQALGLGQWFDSIIVTGDWGIQFYKPHPRAFVHLQDTFPVCNGRFVYIGDNPLKDFTAPSQLSWQALRVRRPSGLHYQMDCEAGRVAREFEDLSEVPGTIAEIFPQINLGY